MNKTDINVVTQASVASVTGLSVVVKLFHIFTISHFHPGLLAVVWDHLGEFINRGLLQM